MPISRTIEVRADQKKILVDRRRSVVGDSQTDLTLFAETRIHIACLGVQGAHLVRRRVQNSRRIVAIAGPIGDAAKGGKSTLDLMHPNLFSGLRVKRYDAVSGRQ